MIKINNKGFLLTEAIVVAVFVMGMFVYLAINVFPLITKYDKALNYDNPNEVYNINLLYDSLRNEFNFDNNDGRKKYLKYYSVENGSLSCSEDDGDCASYSIFQKDYYKTLIYEYLNIDRILIYKKSINSNQKNKLDRDIREYYNYALNHYSYSDIVMIARFNYGDNNHKFASIIYNNFSGSNKNDLVDYSFIEPKYKIGQRLVLKNLDGSETKEYFYVVRNKKIDDNYLLTLLADKSIGKATATDYLQWGSGKSVNFLKNFSNIECDSNNNIRIDLLDNDVSFILGKYKESLVKYGLPQDLDIGLLTYDEYKRLFQKNQTLYLGTHNYWLGTKNKENKENSVFYVTKAAGSANSYYHLSDWNPTQYPNDTPAAVRPVIRIKEDEIDKYFSLK